MLPTQGKKRVSNFTMMDTDTVGHQISGYLSLRSILFGNKFCIRYFFSYIRNFPFRIRTVCFFLPHNTVQLYILLSLNRMVKFNDTPIDTIESLRLSIEVFSPACPHE